jgi:transposase
MLSDQHAEVRHELRRKPAADRRLHHRWTTMQARKKRSTVIAVAVARELAGWCWSLAVMND